MEWIDGPPKVRELNKTWIIEFAGDTVMAAKDVGDTGYQEIGSIQGLRRRCDPQNITRHMEYVPRELSLSSWRMFQCQKEDGTAGFGVVSGNEKYFVEWPNEDGPSTVSGPLNSDELRAMGIKVTNMKAIKLCKN